MIKILDIIGFLGVITSLAAAVLSLCTITYLELKVSYNVALLIFIGTLFIYNLDHILSLESDKLTNPVRTKFINKNKIIIYLIILFSLIASFILCFIIGLKNIIYLLPAFILGILHGRIKHNCFIAAVYITVCWILVTIIFPASISDNLIETYPLILMIGLTLFSNALTSSSKDNINSKKFHKLSIYIVFLAIVINSIMFRSSYALLFMPILTFLALLNFRNDERYELLFLDGFLLLGGLMSLVVLYVI